MEKSIFISVLLLFSALSILMLDPKHILRRRRRARRRRRLVFYYDAMGKCKTLVSRPKRQRTDASFYRQTN